MTATKTSLAELQKNTASLAKKPEYDGATAVGFSSGASFNLTYRIAQVFSQSSLVPKNYQGQPGNCMIAIHMANRLGADPLMVMQNLYIVYGSPVWSAQFLIATFNMSGRFSSIRYRWAGEKGADSFGCSAYAIETSTGQELEGSQVTIALAKKEGWYTKSGSKWQTMPEQMLMYRAASWLVRAYAPEIAMGLHTAEEMFDIHSSGNNNIDDLSAPASITTVEVKSAPTPHGLYELEKALKEAGLDPNILPEPLANRFKTTDPSELAPEDITDAKAWVSDYVRTSCAE